MAVLFIGGCRANGPAISQVSGNYSGNLIAHSGASFQKTSVQSQVPETQNQSKAIAVNDSSGKLLLQLDFTHLTNSGLAMASSDAITASMALQFDPATGCYFADTPMEVKLCASDPEITFDVKDLKGVSQLSLVLYAEGTHPNPTETPQTFSLSQAIARAQTMSFQSKIEFEHVIQAREAATAAYLHLLPQLTLPTLLNNTTPSFSSLLGAIADLAPFLLPSRWIEAKEAAEQSLAEQDAERLMRLDMATQVQGLFYAYDRDKKSQAIYRSFETRVNSILESVTQAEVAGRLVGGSADTVQAAYNDLTHNDGVFDQVLTEDRSALAQSLGFFSPLAVQDAVIDGEQNPVETACIMDFNQINPETLSRSIEIDQINTLISEAKLSKKEEYFDWLDPVANPQLGLGAALPSQLKIAQSQVNELNDVRDQTTASISQEALNAVTDYDQAIDNFQDAQSDTVLHEHRLNTVLQQLASGSSINAFDLCSVIADDLGSNLALEQARADYRVARAEIDRLLLQGYYQSF